MFARSHSIKDHPKEVAGVAAGAAIIGAATAMLVTPRRGSEVRSGLKRRGSHAKHKAMHIGHAEKEVAEHAAARAKSTATKIKEDAKETGREAKAAIRASKVDHDEMAEEIRKRGEP